jgi:hypothetical protein
MRRCKSIPHPSLRSHQSLPPDLSRQLRPRDLPGLRRQSRHWLRPGLPDPCRPPDLPDQLRPLCQPGLRCRSDLPGLADLSRP